MVGEHEAKNQVAPTDQTRTNKMVVAVLILAIVGLVAFLLLGGVKKLRGPSSRFARELGQEKYEEVPPPATPPVFRWDFSQPDVVYTYDYEMKTRMHQKSDKGDSSDHDMDMESSINGLLLVKSRGDGTADLEMNDGQWKVSFTSRDDETVGSDRTSSGGQAQTVEQTMPPMVARGMKEDGSGPLASNPVGIPVETLFPLPSTPLEVGESVDMGGPMSFGPLDTATKGDCQRHITLKRYVKIGERTCAQFEVDIVTSVKGPGNPKSQYKLSSKEKSVYYFDVASRSFVSGATVVSAKYTERPTSGSMVPDMPKGMKMSQESDTLYKVTLRE